MRLLFALSIITILCEAKKGRPDKIKMIPEPEVNYDELKIIHNNDETTRRYIHVPFGHIFKDGMNPNAKPPVDLLELEQVYSKKLPNTQLKKKKEQPKGFASPRDAILYGEDKVAEDKKESKGVWLDLAGTYRRNVASKRRNFEGNRGRPDVRADVVKQRQDYNLQLSEHQEEADYIPKEQFFSRSSYQLKKRDFHFNWTTCDEFGHNADFHPKDVVTMDWVPFYAWTPASEPPVAVAYVHRFSNPTVKLVQKYKDEFFTHLNATADWKQPKLLMKSNFEMLLIAADRRGEFIGIPYNEIPISMKQKQITVPSVNLRLKIVDPYLAMMFCDHRYATIMAISGNEPETLMELRAAAATLKFHGRGYPIARNIQLERMVARREKEIKIEIEKEKEDFTE